MSRRAKPDNATDAHSPCNTTTFRHVTDHFYAWNIENITFEHYTEPCIMPCHTFFSSKCFAKVSFPHKIEGHRAHRCTALAGMLEPAAAAADRCRRRCRRCCRTGRCQRRVVQLLAITKSIRSLHVLQRLGPAELLQHSARAAHVSMSMCRSV